MVNLPSTFVRALSSQERCATLSSHFTSPGLASIQAAYLAPGTVATIPEVCASPFDDPNDPTATPVSLCHVSVVINTTTTSQTLVEAWLPDDWNGRLLATGTGGFAGCVDFNNMQYGTSLGFASFGTNAGHTGPSGAPFLNQPEVINDFFQRSIHVEAVVAKQLVNKYYSKSKFKSYYLGCSQGGRQGFYAAENYPDDFDGIIAGNPAIDIYNLSALRQCDALDGKVDGTIAYPDRCAFNPSALLCSKTRGAPCLKKPQVDGLKQLYSDLYDDRGKLIFPRYAPGAEATSFIFNVTFSGEYSLLLLDAYRYLVYNDSNWDPINFSMADVHAVQKLQPGNGATFTGDLRKFKRSGGKLLTYHGAQDTLINAGISELQYKMTASATGAKSLDDWYAFYLVQGMDHCSNAVGTAAGPGTFGQMKDPRNSNSPKENVLLALVDWVEKGHKPKTIVGTTNAGEKQAICKYPLEGRWNKNGTVWECPR